jgi:sugar O-acyltransferase (sialic acid O-acetyltransferase NeuD family)
MTPDATLIILGAGGHGRVVADIAVQAGWTVVGFVDDNIAPGTPDTLSLPVLGDRDWFYASPQNSCRVALGIGDNYTRMVLVKFLKMANIRLATVMSPFAVVSPFAQIGPGTVIMPGAVVNAGAIIGEGVIINTGAVVEHDTRVGNYAHLSSNSTLGGGADVGEFTHIALGATVLPLIHIGNRTILGAGSVATRSIPDDVIAFGIPARIRRDAFTKPRMALV